MRKLMLSFAAVAAVGFAIPASSEAKNVSLTAKLKGSKEVPGPGDEDGKGNALIKLNAAKGKVCFNMTVKNIDGASAAHIHSGSKSEAGDVVVALLAEQTSDKVIKGCVKDIDASVINDIVANPKGFYVNVHNADFPNGAIRGQLGKKK